METRETKKVLMQDIARDLGISKSLVSKVLSNRLGTSGVSGATAARIKKRAEELGYRINLSARALRRGSLGTIGLFFHRTGDPGSGIVEKILQGVVGAAHEAGKKVIVALFEEESEFQSLSASYSGLIDGMILCGIEHPELKEELLQVVRSGTPVVSMYSSSLAPEIPNVCMKDEEIESLAIRHLVAQGCRKIGFVETKASIHRCRAPLLSEAGLPPVPAFVFQSGALRYSYEAGAAAARKILDESVDIDGLMTDSDAQAIAAVHTLLKAGVRIPEQLKVVAVAATPYCSYAMVPITSVAHQLEESGRAAVCLMAGLLEGRKAKSVHIPPVLKAYASTGGG